MTEYQGTSTKKYRNKKSKSSKKSSKHTSNIYSEFDNIQEGGTHECTRVGNLIPSFRKQTQKKQYETKQKSLKGTLKAQQQKRQAAEYMKKLQEERLTRSPNHQKTNKEVVSSPPSKQNKQL